MKKGIALGFNKGGYLLVPVALLTGIVVSIFLFLLLRGQERQSMLFDFNMRANTRIADIRDTIQDNLDLLSSIAGFYDSSQDVERLEFRKFVNRMLINHPDIKAVMWIPRITDVELKTYEEAILKDGLSDFKIQEFDASHNLVEMAERKEYFPVYYVEPFEANKVILGVDFNTDAIHRKAMEQAASSGLMSVTERIKFIRRLDEYGCKVFVPIYRKDAPIDTPQERRENLAGFLAMLLDFREMVNFALANKPLISMDTYIYDEDSPSGSSERLLYYHIARTRTNSPNPVSEDDNRFALGLKKSETLNVGGRIWKIMCRPAPRFFEVHKNWQSWFVFAIGLLLTAVLVRNLFLVLSRTAKIESLVQERTEELRKSEEHFRTLVGNIAGVIYRCVNDEQWTMDFVSDAIMDISGYPASDFIQNKIRSYASIIYPEDREMVNSVIQGAVSKKAPYIIEYRIMHANKSIVWVYEKGQGIFSSQGALLYLDGAIFDITERKKAQDKITSAAREWSITFDSMADGVSIHSVNFEILNANTALCKILGKPKEEIVGKKCYEIFHGKNHPVMGCPIEETKNTHERGQVELFEPTINRWLAVSVSPIFNEHGEITKVIHVIRDITENKHAEEELQRINQELQKLDQLKSEFVSVVSHELRTPISIIKEGISQILDGLHGAITEGQKKFLSIAVNNIDRLAGIINDLLDISKIESGKIQLNRELTDMVGLAESIILGFEAKAKAKGLEIKKDLPKEKVSLYIDKNKIIQAITNLVGNAIKFTAKGSILISIIDKPDLVECRIIDTGIGIAKENLPKVFNKFEQFARNVGTSGEKGTGLGLSIVKGIIELHKGTIWVESELGQGTKFIFSIPKYTVKELTQERIATTVKNAIKEQSVISSINLDIIAKALGKDRLDAISHNMEGMIKEALRLNTDMIINKGNAILILLPAVRKEDALIILGRVKQIIDEYLYKDNLAKEVEIKPSLYSFPEDAKTKEELLSKIT